MPLHRLPKKLLEKIIFYIFWINTTSDLLICSSCFKYAVNKSTPTSFALGLKFLNILKKPADDPPDPTALTT